jgi:uncharacterized iron-regulated protein
MNDKQDFHLNELARNSIFAAFHRARVYAVGELATDEKREELRNALRQRLCELGLTYSASTSEERHLLNIQNLADEMTRRFCTILKDGTFRIGIAQKALNMYLKYLWCLEIIEEPPHCPFDSIVIANIGLSERESSALAWTKINSVEDYKTLVSWARTHLSKTTDRSLAAWELKIHAYDAFGK